MSGPFAILNSTSEREETQADGRPEKIVLHSLSTVLKGMNVNIY